LKKPRSYERYEKKCDRFGGSKSPKNPISVGEEYIVTIEETSKSGTGVAKIRGFVVLVNNSNPGEKVMGDYPIFALIVNAFIRLP
jgi:predicted RNA-binding protein with TRAM domain